MIRKNKPFPFKNEGPPNKRTEAEKREFQPPAVKGYIPDISMAAVVKLRRQGITHTSVMVLQLLVREQKIEASRHRPTDKLRVPSSVRRNLLISNKTYGTCLKNLAEVGALELHGMGTRMTATIIIDTDTEVQDVLVDMRGNERERRW